MLFIKKKTSFALSLLLILFAGGVVGIELPDLPECQGNLIDKWTDCVGAQELEENVFYVGGYKDGLFHGLGHLKFANEDSLSGNFENGKLLGGKLFLCREDGSCYEGEVNGEMQKHGYGKETLTDGSIFEGLYSLGNPLEGVFTQNGRIFKGKIKATKNKEGVPIWEGYGLGTLYLSENKKYHLAESLPEKLILYDLVCKPSNTEIFECDFGNNITYKGKLNKGLFYGEGQWSDGSQIITSTFLDGNPNGQTKIDAEDIWCIGNWKGEAFIGEVTCAGKGENSNKEVTFNAADATTNSYVETSQPNSKFMNFLGVAMDLYLMKKQYDYIKSDDRQAVRDCDKVTDPITGQKSGPRICRMRYAD